jgi:hypothetical protein
MVVALVACKNVDVGASAAHSDSVLTGVAFADLPPVGAAEFDFDSDWLRPCLRRPLDVYTCRACRRLQRAGKPPGHDRLSEAPEGHSKEVPKPVVAHAKPATLSLG